MKSFSWSQIDNETVLPHHTKNPSRERISQSAAATEQQLASMWQQLATIKAIMAAEASKHETTNQLF